MKPTQTQVNPPLVQAMLDYEALGRRRFHMPGHAGQPLAGEIPGLTPEAYRYDQTEVEGLDVLSEPEGCLLEAQKRVAQVFGVSRSWFLVNGATVGLMAAMLSALRPGDKVLLPRNAHRSVVSGLILTGAEPVWFLPEYLPEWGLWGAVWPEIVADLLGRHPDIQAMMLTSPTYEGIGSDVGALSAICREHGVLLLVDEAHGSLWPFSDELPTSACRLPVDFVVQSPHKSAGSLTQTALAHLPESSRLDPVVFQQALNTLQTTSPSYLLMASLDATIDWLAGPEATARIAAHLDEVRDFRAQLAETLETFRLFSGEGCPVYDPSRIYLANPLLPGQDWAVRMEAGRLIAYESTSPFGSLYIASLGLTREDYEAFLAVFRMEDREIQARYAAPSNDVPDFRPHQLPAPMMQMTPRAAFFSPGQTIPLVEAVGRIAKQTVVHCPPGVPVLLPGELLQPGHLPYLNGQAELMVTV